MDGADQTEISLLEVMLYQDIQNNGKTSWFLRLATLSRHYRPMKFLSEINDFTGYEKIITICGTYDYNPLTNKSPMVLMYISHLCFVIMRKMRMIIG